MSIKIKKMYKSILFTIVMMSLTPFGVVAQDVIVTRDSKRIEARVTEIDVNDIKYKNFNNIDGPVYVLSKANIVAIIYQNGNVETFNSAVNTPAITASAPVNTSPASAPVLVNTQQAAPANIQQPAPEPAVSTSAAGVRSQENQLSNDYALLHIYRVKSMAGAAIGYDLHLDNDVIFRVKNNSKTTIRVTSGGRKTLWAKTESRAELPIDIEMGQEYYILCGVGMGAVVGRPRLELVDNQRGEAEFAKVR